MTHSPVVPQSLVYRIHAAGDWNCGWRDTLDLLRRRLNASLVVLGSHNFSNGQGELVCESPESPALRAAYARYASRNPWFLSSQDYADGRVMSGEELISNRELIRMDFYRDVVRPFGLFRRLCAVAARRNDMVAYVATHRAEHQSAFRERHKSLLKSLLPHLSLALEQRWRFAEADQIAKALMRIIDQNGRATVLATRDGRIVFRNKAASESGDRLFGLRLNGDVLNAATPAEQKALYEAVEQVAGLESSDAQTAARVVTLSSPHAGQPPQVVVRPAGRVFLSDAALFRDLVTVTASSPWVDHDPCACPFARQFELTPAQSKVSALVFAGNTLPVIARTLRVSENTVRSHLKQIFQKTNTYGQMELVHRHARICINKL